MAYVNTCRNRVFILRKSKGISSRAKLIAAVKEATGVKISSTVISKFEKHESENGYVRHIKALADFFGVTTDYLMGRVDYNANEIENIPEGLKVEDFPEYRMYARTMREKVNAYMKATTKEEKELRHGDICYFIATIGMDEDEIAKDAKTRHLVRKA